MLEYYELRVELYSCSPIAECFSTLGKPNLHAQLPFGPKKHWSFARAHVFMTFGFRINHKIFESDVISNKFYCTSTLPLLYLYIK